MSSTLDHIGKFISIHAPREGCDLRQWSEEINRFLFQSTHPVRGATALDNATARLQTISIHAPREGCDPTIAGMWPRH